MDLRQLLQQYKIKHNIHDFIHDQYMDQMDEEIAMQLIELSEIHPEVATYLSQVQAQACQVQSQAFLKALGINFGGFQQ